MSGRRARTRMRVTSVPRALDDSRSRHGLPYGMNRPFCRTQSVESAGVSTGPADAAGMTAVRARTKATMAGVATAARRTPSRWARREVMAVRLFGPPEWLRYQRSRSSLAKSE